MIGGGATTPTTADPAGHGATAIRRPSDLAPSPSRPLATSLGPTVVAAHHDESSPSRLSHDPDGAACPVRHEPERDDMATGDSLRQLRARRPLVHQITNFVVMNETANATLALGALPVMAHAPEEVAEMAGAAHALVLNIGTLSASWVDAMILAGTAANQHGVPVVLDPVGAGATAFRTASARRILDEVDVAVLRGNAGEVASLLGGAGEMRGVESVGHLDAADLARRAARTFGLVASVTGPIDHVADASRLVRVANGHPMLATITGTGCTASALTGCFLAVTTSALDGAVGALVALGVAGEDAAREARGPGSFQVNLYDALAALDPDTLDARARLS